MKKTVLCLAVLLLLAMSLSSCLTPRVTYEPANGTDGIASVRVYYVEKSNGYDAWSDLPDLEAMATASCEVSSDRYGELFEDLAGLDFQDFIPLAPIPMDPNFYVHGYVLAIIYESGAFEYVTPDGIQLHGESPEEDMRTHYTCDGDEWEAFIHKYAPALSALSATGKNTTEAEP